VTDPPLLLADEPTGNLDTRTSLEVLALLQELNRKEGITIVLVTHEHDIAACASRVVTFRDGRIMSDVAQEDRLDQQVRAEPPPVGARRGDRRPGQRQTVQRLGDDNGQRRRHRLVRPIRRQRLTRVHPLDATRPVLH